MLKRTVVLFLCTACLLILHHQAYSSQSLKVGVYQNSPIIFMDSDGIAQGFFIYILETIAMDQQWELTYVPGAWEECLKRLENGEIDLLPDIAWSEEREQIFDFSRERIFTGWIQMYTKKLSSITGYLDLQNKTVAVLKSNYAVEIFKSYLLQYGIEAEYLEKNSFHEVFLAVETGEADAGLVNRYYGELNHQNYRIRQSPLVLAPTEFYFAAPEGKNQDILAAIDSSVAGMKADPKSEYYAAMQKWLDYLEVDQETPLWQYALFGGLLILVILGGIFILSLRAGIRLKTGQLQKSNKKLAQSEALLQEMEKVAKIGGWEYDIEKKTNIWTDEVYRLHGVSPDKYDPDNIESDIIFYEEGESRTAIQSAFGKAVEIGEPFDLELKFRNAQGKLLWVRSIGNPVKEGDKIVKVRGAFQDISEHRGRKNIEQLRMRLLDISFNNSLDDLLRKTIDEIEAASGSAMGFIHFVEADQKTLTLKNWSSATLKTMCTAEIKVSSHSVDKAGVWIDCIHKGEPVIYNDYATVPHRKGLPDSHAPVTRMMSVPVIRDRLVRAIVGVGNKATDYTDKDCELAVKLSDIAWDIIIRKRFEVMSQRNLNVIQAINKVFQETLHCDTLEEVAYACIKLAENLTESEFGLIGEINQSGRFDTLSYGNIRWQICKLPESEAIALSKNMLIRGIWGQAILLNESQIINEPELHPESIGIPEGHPEIKNFLGVPLKHEGKTIGMIGLANKEGGYHPEDRRIVEMLSVAFAEVMNRMKLSEVLRKSEQRYKSLIEGLDDGVLVLDGLEVVMVNCRLMEMFNIEFGIEGKDISELAAGLGIPLEEGEISSHFDRLRKKIPIAYYKLNLITNQQPVSLSIREELMTFEGKQVIRSIIRDESKLAQVEEQFRQSQKMEALGRLAGGIAHDFNNLLTVIAGNAELGKMGLPEDEEELNRYFEQIKKASSRASDMTRQLLAFSRKQTLSPKVCNVNEIIRDVEKILTRLVGETVNIKSDLAADLCNVYVDKGNLDQALINLAVNARDAMPDGGRITISTRNVFIDEKWGNDGEKFNPGEYVEIAFSDNGSGMKKEIQDKIFDPFFTTKEVGKGTGLGLATVLGIIEQHNGYVKCYSESKIGTTFKLYLPRSLAEADEVVHLPKGEEMPGGTESILVVEDSEQIRELAVQVLSRLGYQTFKASNGKEAYSFLKMISQPVDLVLTDVVMPEMNGMELEEQVRNIWPETKVLFMTGYTADVLDDYLTPEKNYQFLHKPFLPQDLAQRVREVLDIGERIV